MNRPQHITFTGLDAKTDLARCQKLSKRYPIEWGTLMGNKTGNHPRYPGKECLNEILLRPLGMKALHLCGRAASTFCEASWEYEQVLEFDRIQINMTPHDYDLSSLRSVASRVPFKIILQHRDTHFPENTSFQYLFDQSGGRGVVPTQIPSYKGENFVGFAGGINPNNVLEWIKQIDAQNYWIDMESGVRTPEDWLDLDSCESVCQQIWGDYGHG